jgi:hypothetical protein
VLGVEHTVVESVDLETDGGRGEVLVWPGVESRPVAVFTVLAPLRPV